MMKPEDVERKKSEIEEAYIRLSRKQEQIPAYLNEDSEIMGSDPLELCISHPITQKEKGCISHQPLHKKKPKDAKPSQKEEEKELDESVEWDTKEDGVGRFDEHGNFVIDSQTADEPSTGDEWTVVEQKPKKKKQKDREEQLTYTAVQTAEYKSDPKTVKKQKEKGKPAEHQEESDVDSDGFKLVQDKKGKKNKKH
ncbi:uncharacterized protein NEMAJ01_0844 [Nematocida major]|uniref:uncharacterized protein n=1 Tax=Nematocida major TaxID=1912982 RepID=UPI0020088F9C|nr:uncharacterized protein NEMAJ01_0844 [Nematocida major]KAH9385948.1 hypothetical protein NEMAJ01_0844 [Nematocida major]